MGGSSARILGKSGADRGELSTDGREFGADTGKFSADTGKFSADIGKFSADTGKLSLDTGKLPGCLTKQPVLKMDGLSLCSYHWWDYFMTSSSSSSSRYKVSPKGSRSRRSPRITVSTAPPINAVMNRAPEKKAMAAAMRLLLITAVIMRSSVSGVLWRLR